MTSNYAIIAGLVAVASISFWLGSISARRKTRCQMEAARLGTLKATMRTVQLVVNNFFNTLLLVELEIKGHLRSGALDQIECGMQETFERLKAIGDLETVKEIPFATGPLLAYPDIAPKKSSGNQRGARAASAVPVA